ncbi:MAG: hypothetical protein WC702_02385 [Patescibacteria group bacterium]|jgi:hypothetical protein
MFREGYSPERGSSLRVPETDNPAEAIAQLYDAMRKKGITRADAKGLIAGILKEKFVDLPAGEVGRVLDAYTSGVSTELLGKEVNWEKRKAA